MDANSKQLTKTPFLERMMKDHPRLLEGFTIVEPTIEDQSKLVQEQACEPAETITQRNTEGLDW